MEDDPQDLIDALDDLLDDERAALLAGDIDRISRLAHRKEILIDTLNALQAPPQEGMAALQGKVARNQTLLNSALAGIRAVSDRMAALRRVRQSLDTYDQNGRRCSLDTQQPPKVEKRA